MKINNVIDISYQNSEGNLKSEVGHLNMKIAIDIRKIGKRSTGDETYTFHLVRELASLKESQKHNYLLLTDQRVAKIKQILGKLPSNFEVIKVAPTNKLFWTFYSLPRFLRKNPVDILHVQYIAPFHLYRKTKIVTTIHDVSFRANPEWIGKSDSLIMNNFIPLSLKRADAVITVSNFSKSEITKYYRYPKEKIFVTHPAIDERFFSTKAKIGEKNALKNIVGGKNPYVLHISSMQPRKNVPLVIKAYAKMKAHWKRENSQWKNTKLVLVGDKYAYNYDKGIDEEILKQVQNDKISINDIITTGYLPYKLLPIIYRNALVFIFPSAYEGFGLPLLEAMACKLPVIASNIGSLKEIGGNAALFTDLRKSKEKAVSDIAQSAINIVENSDLRRNIIAKGTERIKLYNWKDLAKATLNIYEKIV